MGSSPISLHTLASWRHVTIMHWGTFLLGFRSFFPTLGWQWVLLPFAHYTLAHTATYAHLYPHTGHFSLGSVPSLFYTFLGVLSHRYTHTGCVCLDLLSFTFAYALTPSRGYAFSHKLSHLVTQR